MIEGITPAQRTALVRISKAGFDFEPTESMRGVSRDMADRLVAHGLVERGACSARLALRG